MGEFSEKFDSIKHVETNSEEWFEAEFSSMTQAEAVRNSETVDLHNSDDKRKKTVRLDVDNPNKTIEQIAKNALDQPDIPEEW